MTAALAWTVDQLLNIDRMPARRVSRREYEDWRRYAIWDCVQGQRYGQSFCNKFDIHDTWLYNCNNTKYADSHIKKNYVKRNAKKRH